MLIIQPRPLQYSMTTNLQTGFQRLKMLRTSFDQRRNLERLAIAAETGDFQALAHILLAIDLVQCRKELNEALVSSILERDDPAIVSLLLEHGADIEAITRYSDDATPLMFAAGAGHLETVRLLVERGANLYARDGYWNNALHYANEAGQSHSAEFLIEIAPELLEQSNLTEDGEQLYPDEVTFPKHSELAARQHRLATNSNQCHSCQFFTNNSFLFCAVRPYWECNCSDFKSVNEASHTYGNVKN